MQWAITRQGTDVIIEAGIIREVISVQGSFPELTSLAVGDGEMLERPSGNTSLDIHLANPDAMPRGIAVDTISGEITQENTESRGTDSLDIRGTGQQSVLVEPVAWVPIAHLDDLVVNKNLGKIGISIEDISKTCQRVTTSIPVTSLETLTGITIEIIHEIHGGYPAIRKWLVISNAGTHWLKIDNLVIEPMQVRASPRYHRVFLTPSERGAAASVIAFEHEDRSHGIMTCSEVPSALRDMAETGSMGYTNDYFEWVIGPGERFESEAVFVYAFQGNVLRTRSGVSTPLDRTVEGEFKLFLESVIGVRAKPEEMPVPLWCTWSNFVANINDQVIHEQARLASQAGFRGFQIDAGWSDSMNPSDWTSGGRIPHAGKFPDFLATCAFVKSQGLRLGLWTSCYRNAVSPDLHDLPGCTSFPKVKRGECYGMSYASEWRYYHAKDLIYLHDTYGVTYFKQDLTNIKFGDIAKGHDSRTRKESLLRALRGLFETQDTLHAKAPGVSTLLSHELYWGTPGTPCDLAAIKHCWSFHIPPNDYSGAFPRAKRIIRKPTFWKMNRWGLLRGCFNARRRFYAHRGLPLYCIEYYGAATVNKDGSLTPAIQDRQVCSWLMGIPSVYAGDLSSLTEENIKHYKKRFDLVVQLQQKHDIFRYFQYSGVPAPTDTGWHWWGKLSPAGNGVVIVMRGFLGSWVKHINVPWVPAGHHYKIISSFSGKDLGEFSSEMLHQGKLRLSLPPFSQEILEITRKEG